MLQVQDSRGGCDLFTPPSCCSRKCWDRYGRHRNEGQMYTAAARRRHALHCQRLYYFCLPSQISCDFWRELHRLCSNTNILNSRKRMEKCNFKAFLKNRLTFSAFWLDVSPGASASFSVYSNFRRISVNTNVNYLQSRIPKANPSPKDPDKNR